MQMIDVMKRLAELDAGNPNVLKEDVDPSNVQALSQQLAKGEIDYDTFRSELDKLEHTAQSMRQGEMGLQGDDTPAGHSAWGREEQDWNDLDDYENDYGDEDEYEGKNLAECGPMGMIGGMASSNIPANINITAASGEELSNMLGAIMKLAGVEKVTPDHLGSEHEPTTLTATPTIGVGPSIGDKDDMRAVLDKMNDTGEEETDEGYDEFGISGVDNTPHRPDAHKAFSANAYSQNTNDGDGDNEHGHKRTGMQPIATFESLMAEYKQFVAEDGIEDFLNAGGKIQQIKPQKGPKRPGLTFGSKHIGRLGGTGKASNISGLGANTGKNSKPVVAVEEENEDNIAERMGEAIPIQIKFEDGTVKGEQIVDGEATSMMSRQQLVQHFSEKYKKPVAEIIVRSEPTPYQEPATRAYHEPYEEPKSANPYGHRRGADSDFR